MYVNCGSRNARCSVSKVEISNQFSNHVTYRTKKRVINRTESLKMRLPFPKMRKKECTFTPRAARRAWLGSFHVIGVCLLNQSASEKQIKKKSPQTFAHFENFWNMHRSCLIIRKSCYFDYSMNRPFTRSRCVICVSRAAHVIFNVLRAQRIMDFFLSQLPTNQRDQNIRS